MPTIGDTVARLRRQRSLTQEQLAERAGISVETIRKLETGARTSARIPTLASIARALDVPTSRLLGDASTAAARREPHHRTVSLMELRRALTPGRSLGSAVADPSAGEPLSLDGVQAALSSADGAYHRGDYATALAELPALITAARAAVDADGDQHAHSLLAAALILTGELLIQLRAVDLAYSALDEAITEAERGDDQVHAALSLKGMSWILLRQGRLVDAEVLAVRNADAIEPRMSRATPEELAVWGWLLLGAAGAAARDNRGPVALEMLDSAAAAAARIGDRPMPARYLTILGGLRPGRVEMMRAEVAAVTGQPDQVLRLAETIRPGTALPTSWQRHRLDVAWAYAETSRWSEATQVLTELHDRAPAWLRHQRYARDIVTTITTNRRRAMTRQLADLALLVGAD